MRFWVLAVLACFALASRPIMAAGDEAPAGARGEVFEPGTVWQFHLTFTAAEYQAMQPRSPGLFAFLGSPRANKSGEKVRELHRNMFGMDLPWATGTVEVEGQALADVSIRYKGNGTIGDAARSIKKSFKIDLDRSGGEARFHEHKTINLHCGAADPSKCRETFGYRLYRAAGVPASRTALAEVRLTVPGKYDHELLGVFTLVEQVDKPFLRSHFGSDKGLLMKPEGQRDFAYLGEKWERYQGPLVPKREATPEEASRLVEFARLISRADDDEFRSRIGEHLEIEAYLKFLAVTAFVSNSDSFFALGHNYYLYLHPESGKLHFIPWDLDRAFANFPIFGSNDQQLNLSLARPYLGPHRLTDRLLAMPEVKEKFQALLVELAATCFAKERLHAELAEIEAATKEPLARDAAAAAARKDPGPPPMFGRPPDLKTFVEKRSASLAAQAAGNSQGHIPSGLPFLQFGKPAGPPPEPKKPVEAETR